MPQDPEQAFLLAEKAAATGNSLAKANLGFMYAHSVGINADERQSLVLA